MTAWSSRQGKENSDFFLFWLEDVSFHCVEYSNEIELKRQQMRKKNKKQKTEISINEEPKLRIKSQITVIIIALDKSKTLL